MRIGVQSLNIIHDENPAAGFKRIAAAGFDCCDFGQNGYLLNSDLYRTALSKDSAGIRGGLFDRSEEEIAEFFRPHIEGAKAAGVVVNQMHMPYPDFVPGAPDEVNDYLKNVMAPKSLYIASLFHCPYIVVHGFKLAHFLGSEEAEWEETKMFLEYLAPTAKALGVTMCIENIYTGVGGRIIEGPCCDAVKAVRRIDDMNNKFGAEILGFCLDTGHANLVGIDYEPFIRTLGSRLKVLHIHDNDGIADLHQIPYTFTRERNNRPSTDWDGFLSGLRAIHFDGVLNFETAPVLKSFPPELADDALAFIAKIGRYFAGRIER